MGMTGLMTVPNRICGTVVQLLPTQKPCSHPSRGMVKPRASAGTNPAAGNGNAIDGTTFLRRHLLELAPYTPIEPFEVLSAKLGRAAEDIVKLDANENPYGPPPEVREALGNVKFPHIYPDPESRALRALSEWS